MIDDNIISIIEKHKMGIRYLNKYLLSKCTKKSIDTIHIKQMKNKTIVVDASIYLYKFIGEDTFVESLYLMITTFMRYNIKLIFVFDGKPPPEKWQTIIDRNNAKSTAEQTYKELQDIINDDDYDENDKVKMKIQLETIKKQCIRIRKYHIDRAKEIMNCFGVKYIDATGEADEICAKMCISGLAYGCLSDDMDMMTYGCPIILRNLNLLKQTIMIYNYENILDELQMSYNIMKELLILSTNDYVKNNDNNFIETMKWYNQYKIKSEDVSFKEWLLKHTKYLSNNPSIDNLEEIYNLDDCLDVKIKNILLSRVNNKLDKKEIKNVLKEEGFIFI